MSSKSSPIPSAAPRDPNTASPKLEGKDGNSSSVVLPKTTAQESKPSNVASNAESKRMSSAANENDAKKNSYIPEVLTELGTVDPAAKHSATRQNVKGVQKPSTPSDEPRLSNSPSSSGDIGGIPSSTPTPEREMSRGEDRRRMRGQSHDSLNSSDDRNDHRPRRRVHERLGTSRSGSDSRDYGRHSRHHRESPRNSSRRSIPRNSDYYRGRSRSMSRSRSRDRSISPSRSYDSTPARRRKSRSSSRSRGYSGYSRKKRRRDKSRSWERRRSPSSSRSRSPRRDYYYRSPSRSPRSRRDSPGSRRYSPRSYRDYGYRRSYPPSDGDWSPRKDRRTRYYSPPRHSGHRSRQHELDGSAGYSRSVREKKRRRYSGDVDLDGARDLRTIFVWRLVQQVKEADVFTFFSRAGKVRDVRLIMDRRSSRHKGAGYVEFYTQDSVKRAVALAGGSICGFPVAVKSSVDESATMLESGARMLNASTEHLGRSSLPAASPTVLSSPGNASGGQIPITAVGWSMAARQPVRQAPSSSGLPKVSSAGGSVGMVGSNVPTELVSVKELAVLLNPHNLPIASVPMNASVSILPGQNASGSPALLEQVPLPSPSGNTTGITKAGAVGYTRLYVGSVPFQLTESDLHEIFAPFGTITSLQLQRDTTTGRSRGYGFVEYAEHSSAKKAMAINGIDVAGRPLKVALASQDARAIGARGNGMSGGAISGSREVTGELDEGREGGVLMNASQKALLRERLSRGESMVSGSLSAAGVPWSKTVDTTQIPSKSLLLSNMFNPSLEPAGFEQELAEDVRDECASKYGMVTHLYVDKQSRGLVYIRFASIDIAQKAMISLNGRWFGGQRISAAYILDDIYRKRFPEAPF